jgi:multiple sugar transport system ATP-binding protein
VFQLSATIDRVEALGSNLLAFFTVDAPPATSAAIAEATGGGLQEVALITREGTPFCATFEPRSAVRVGDRVDVSLDTRRLHFFDPETETAIGT